MIKFTRHARRRMLLYGICEEEAEAAISNPDKTDVESTRQIVYKMFEDRFKGNPLKVVFVEEAGKL